MLPSVIVELITTRTSSLRVIQGAKVWFENRRYTHIHETVFVYSFGQVATGKHAHTLTVVTHVHEQLCKQRETFSHYLQRHLEKRASSTLKLENTLFIFRSLLGPDTQTLVD